MLACMGMHAMAQEKVDVTGVVFDRSGNPVSGAAVTVVGEPESMVSTDAAGKFVIPAIRMRNFRFLLRTMR